MARTISRSGDRILWTGEGWKAKAKPTGIKSNLLLSFTLFMLFLIAGSLFYVWSRIQVIQLGYEISTALKEERVLLGANKRLRLEIATLKSYARIEKIAVEELRMVKPKPNQVIVIR
jgi:cell division protein FtsL